MRYYNSTERLTSTEQNPFLFTSTLLCGIVLNLTFASSAFYVLANITASHFNFMRQRERYLIIDKLTEGRRG